MLCAALWLDGVLKRYPQDMPEMSDGCRSHLCDLQLSPKWTPTPPFNLLGATAAARLSFSCRSYMHVVLGINYGNGGASCICQDHQEIGDVPCANARVTYLLRWTLLVLRRSTCFIFYILTPGWSNRLASMPYLKVSPHFHRAFIKMI